MENAFGNEDIEAPAEAKAAIRQESLRVGAYISVFNALEKTMVVFIRGLVGGDATANEIVLTQLSFPRMLRAGLALVQYRSGDNEEVEAVYRDFEKKARRARDIRNEIAHGTPVLTEDAKHAHLHAKLSRSEGYVVSEVKYSKEEFEEHIRLFNEALAALWKTIRVVKEKGVAEIEIRESDEEQPWT